MPIEINFGDRTVPVADHEQQFLERQLQTAGIDDPTGEYFGVLYRASQDDAYAQRLMAVNPDAPAPWPQLAQIHSALVAQFANQPAPGAQEQPQASTQPTPATTTQGGSADTAALMDMSQSHRTPTAPGGLLSSTGKPSPFFRRQG